MISVWTSTLIAVLLISLVSLIGVFTLSLRQNKLQKILFILVSFAVGGLLGDAFLHLIPESFEKFKNPVICPVFVLLGIIMFFALEKFVRWRHCHIPTSTAHPHPMVLMNLIGDGVHNAIDGMAVAASFLVSFPIGVATTLAILLHEVPQEIGDFGILIHGGLSIQKALLYNFISALSAIVGAVIVLLIGPYMSGFAEILLPITAGGFIYLAGSDLIPALHDDTDLVRAFLQLFFILLGMGIMLLLLIKT